MSEARGSREKKTMERFAPPAAKDDGDKNAIYEVHTPQVIFSKLLFLQRSVIHVLH